MGFSIVCQRRGAMDMLTSTAAARRPVAQRKVATRDLLHVTRWLNTWRALWRPLERRPSAVGVQRWAGTGQVNVLTPQGTQSWGQRRILLRDRKPGKDNWKKESSPLLSSEKAIFLLLNKEPTGHSLWAPSQAGFLHHMANANTEWTTTPLWVSVFSSIKWMCSQATSEQGQVSVKQVYSLERDCGKEATGTGRWARLVVLHPFQSFLGETDQVVH